MGVKVSFDSVNRIIQVTTAPVVINGEDIIELDFQVDVYSDGKEDWLANEALRKLRFPIRAVGGDLRPGGAALGDSYYLASDWKIAPYEGNHRFLVIGNVYSEDGTNPFNRTIANYNVFLEREVSAIVESSIVQADELSDMHAALIHRRTRDPVTGLITVYQSDGVTPRFTYDSTDNGQQIIEIDPNFVPAT